MSGVLTVRKGSEIVMMASVHDRVSSTETSPLAFLGGSEYCLVAAVILKVFTSLGSSRPDLFGPESFGGQVYVDDALLVEMDFMGTQGRVLEARDAYRWSVESFFGPEAIEEKKFASEGIPVAKGLAIWGYECNIEHIHLGPAQATVGYPYCSYALSEPRP